MTEKKKQELQTVVCLADIRARRVELSKGTLAEAWDFFLAAQSMAKLKPTTQAVYKQAATLAIKSLPAKPSRGDVTLWLEAMHREGKAAATVNKILRAMCAITERASVVANARDLTIRNAFKAQRHLEMPARRRRDASDTTLQRLLALAADEFQMLALRLAAFYGLRRGELLALKPEAVTLPLVKITQTRDRFGLRTRKNFSHRRQHILNVEGDAVTMQLIDKLLDESTRLALAKSSQRELALEYLIPWSEKYADKLMKAWKRDAEVTLPRGDAWHSLRHYGATALAGDNAQMLDIQRWLGDATPTAAGCYIGQTRGTTEGTGGRVLRCFERGVLGQKPTPTQTLNPTPAGEKNNGKSTT